MLQKLRRPATTFTITQLCREFGTTPRALRYYEEQGLLPPAEIIGVDIEPRPDSNDRMVMVELNIGLTVAFRASDVQGLESASVADLSAVELDPDGFGLHFPTLDADIWLPGLLAGQFGSQRWMAAQMGKKGGQARSLAKAAASRTNGSKGGRPRKASA